VIYVRSYILTFNNTNIVCANNDNRFSRGRGFVGGWLFRSDSDRTTHTLAFPVQTKKKFRGNIA